MPGSVIERYQSNGQSATLHHRETEAMGVDEISDLALILGQMERLTDGVERLNVKRDLATQVATTLYGLLLQMQTGLEDLIDQCHESGVELNTFFTRESLMTIRDATDHTWLLFQQSHFATSEPANNSEGI